MSEGKVPDPDSSDEMQQEEETASSRPAEAPTETGFSESNPMDIAEDPVKEPKTLTNLQDPKDVSPSKLVIKVRSPSKPPIKSSSPKKSPAKSPFKGKRPSPSKSSEDVHSPSKKKSLEVKTIDESTMEVSSSGGSVEGKTDFPGLGDQASSSEMQTISGSSADTSHLSHAGPSGVSQPSSSDHSDPNHACGEACVHGGARPKERALTITANRSSGTQDDDLNRIVDEMNSFAEMMGTRFSRNPEGFGNVGQPEWTRNIENTRVTVEQLANAVGHGPFTQSSSDNGHPRLFPAIQQLNRMFTGLSLETVNIFGPPTPRRREQERQPRINVDQVPESARPMDVDEGSSSFPGWQVEGGEPLQPMEQEAPNQQPRVEPQEPSREYRVARLEQRAPERGNNIINPSHPYRIRDEGMWRAAMLTAYRSGRYHSNQSLDDTALWLDRVGLSQEEFFRSYPSARKVDVSRDEGLEEERPEPESEEVTIENKIHRVIVAIGFMAVAMLYMRLYIAHHPEIDTSSESSAMDSGNVDRSESEPKAEYARLREHVNIELGSSDSTESSKDANLPEDNSPREIQSPDILPENRESPVDVLVPLSEVPKQSERPSSQSSLIHESDNTSASSSSKKGFRLRRAVLERQLSLSLDNTSSDASPINPDEENKEPKSFGEIVNSYIHNIFRADEESEAKDKETGEAAPGGQDQSKQLDQPGKDNKEDPSQAGSISQTGEDSLNTEGKEVEVKEMEEGISHPGDVSLAISKDDVEGDVGTEETDSAGGSNVAEDDSSMEAAGDDRSKSGQSRKRKDHSDIGGDRLAKKGKDS